MRLFVDESGTPTITDYLTQPYFAVGCLLCEDHHALDAMAHQFKTGKGLALRTEIKFNGSSPTKRREFLEELMSLDVRVSVLVISKKEILDRFDQIKPSLYHYAVGLALDRALKKSVCEHALIDDYLNSKVPNRQFKSYLRQSVNTSSRRAADLVLVTQRSTIAFRRLT